MVDKETGEVVERKGRDRGRGVKVKLDKKGRVGRMGRVKFGYGRKRRG